MRWKLRLILEELDKAPRNPGDIAGKTGLPRYEVLASFHVLEALGFVTTIYSRGTHRVYRLTGLGEKLLQALRLGSFEIDIRTEHQTAESMATNNTPVAMEA